MNMVDDATGITFFTSDAMRLLWRWIERFGIPQALCYDKKMPWAKINGQRPA